MAATIEGKIFKALFERMKTFTLPVGWTLSNNVAFPGMGYTPQTGRPFISFEIHYNRSVETDLTMELDPIRQGFLRANVMWPKGQGDFEAIEVAGSLRAHFRRGTRMTFEENRTDINEDPEIGVIITGDAFITIPVTARWQNHPVATA